MLCNLKVLSTPHASSSCGLDLRLLRVLLVTQATCGWRCSTRTSRTGSTTSQRECASVSSARVRCGTSPVECSPVDWSLCSIALCIQIGEVHCSDLPVLLWRVQRHSGPGHRAFLGQGDRQLRANGAGGDRPQPRHPRQLPLPAPVLSSFCSVSELSARAVPLLGCRRNASCSLLVTLSLFLAKMSVFSCASV